MKGIDFGAARGLQDFCVPLRKLFVFSGLRENYFFKFKLFSTHQKAKLRKNSKIHMDTNIFEKIHDRKILKIDKITIS